MSLLFLFSQWGDPGPAEAGRVSEASEAVAGVELDSAQAPESPKPGAPTRPEAAALMEQSEGQCGIWLSRPNPRPQQHFLHSDISSAGAGLPTQACPPLTVWKPPPPALPLPSRTSASP